MNQAYGSVSFTDRVGFAVDRALSLVAPSWSRNRMNARLQISDLNMRMYAAAKATQDVGGWVPYDGDVNSLIRTSSPQVRARARQLVRDFPYAKRAIKLREALVIGGGIRMQPRIRDNRGKLDPKANNIFESAFARWAEKASVCGKLSFEELQNLSERQSFECGEYFFIKRYLRGVKNPFRLQPIEADRLTGFTTTPAAKGCVIDSGIEYEKSTGRVVAYHFTDEGYSAKTIRVPAEFVIHGYEVERPEQLRGISPIASAVMVAGNLADLLESELEAMRMATRYVAFVRTTNLPGHQQGARKDKNGNVVQHYDHATIQYLQNGDDVTLAKVDRQSGTFEPYVKFNVRTFAVGCGLTYELVSGDYDKISYSNLRGIRLDLSLTIKPIQRARIKQFCRPVSAVWLNSAMLVDPALIPLARRLTPSCVRWIPPGMESPDLLREVKAHADEFKMGTRSPQEICAARGRPYSEVLDEILEAKEMAEERGLTFGDVAAHLKTNPAALMEE